MTEHSYATIEKAIPSYSIKHGMFDGEDLTIGNTNSLVSSYPKIFNYGFWYLKATQ